MATAVKRKTYTSYGNVAYDPEYVPQREEELDGNVGEEQVIRRRERVKSRSRVMVRPAGYVAPMAIIGFAAVAVMAVLILMTYVNITTASNEVVHLRQESAALQEERSKLLSQYELAFDLKTVEETAITQGGMVQPRPEQEITMDLSEPDSATVYQVERNPLAGLWNGIRETVGNIMAFFR